MSMAQTWLSVRFSGIRWGQRNLLPQDHLFTGSADRKMELEKWSGIPAGLALVDIAVTHELGNALCQEKNEYGKELRGQNPSVQECCRNGR